MRAAGKAGNCTDAAAAAAAAERDGRQGASTPLPAPTSVVDPGPEPGPGPAAALALLGGGAAGCAAALQVLDLSGVPLWSPGVTRVAAALPRLPQLHTVVLSDVRLAHAPAGGSGGRGSDLSGAAALGAALRHRFACGAVVAAVESLTLSKNSLDAAALHATLGSVRGLTALDVRQNRLKGRGAAAELRALAGRNELQHLHTAANGADVVRLPHASLAAVQPVVLKFASCVWRFLRITL
jgi:hypothetical protein